MKAFIRIPFLLISFSTLHFASFSQVGGCNDPDAWNYTSWSEPVEGACIYLQDCEMGFVNRIYELDFFYSGFLGSQVYFLSEDLQDTLLQATLQSLFSQNYYANFHSLCVPIDQCILVDIYTPQPIPVNVGAIALYYPESTNFQSYFVRDPYPSDYFRIRIAPDGAEENNCAVLGCTDNGALNYWDWATDDFGCIYCQDTEFYIRPNFGFSQNMPWSIRNENNEYVVGGSFSASSQPHTDELVCLTDGCYHLQISGDGWRFNSLDLLDAEGQLIHSMTLTEDGQARFPFAVNSEPCPEPGAIYGCNNPLGMNYLSAATIDDGSCVLMNDNCSLGLAINLDTVNNVMVFNPSIYATDYPVYIFWDFGDGSPEVENLGWVAHQYENGGEYEICATLYAFIFFENLPLCFDTICVTFNSEDYGFTGGFTVFLNEFSVGLNERNRVGSLEIFPNPASDALTIKRPKDVSAASVLRIFSAEGREVEQVRFAEGVAQISLDIQNYASGVYVLLNQSEAVYQVSRFVKE